jgi:hypothetical protein
MSYIFLLEFFLIIFLIFNITRVHNIKHIHMSLNFNNINIKVATH